MDRRSFLSNACMMTGLSASYLTAMGFGLRYVFPGKNERIQRMLVGLRKDLLPGSATAFTAPDGRTVNVLHGPTGFKALSDICPHLGCKVQWDARNGEFLCPCHDGHFDADGMPTGGPPADMGIPLSTYEVEVDGEMVFLMLRVTK